jgi:inosose dehydratase
MQLTISRRTFLTGLGLAGAATLLPSARASGASGRLRFGYTAMTWGENDRQAIDDIAALGYEGIQFRANIVESFKPAELRELLQRRQLVFTAMSSGMVAIDADPKEEIAKHVANARYVKQCGGQYLQLLDKLSRYGRPVDPDGCARLGGLLTEIGKRTADLGVTACYHNHLNTLSETPAGLDLVMAASDPRYLKFELDTAHAVAGGGDPAQMIERYHERLLFMHLKDVVDLAPGGKGKYPFQFVELGRGRVDLRAIFSALDKVAFSGWAVVELDRVPVGGTTPKASAAISRDYLVNQLGRTLRPT